MNKLFFYACSALLASGAALTAVSCADDDLDNGGTNGKGAVVRFSVNDVQEGAISRGVMTRGAITPGLGSSDLAGGKLTAHSNRNIDVCLIETTVEGVNPVKADAHTHVQKSSIPLPLATSLPLVFVAPRHQPSSLLPNGSTLRKPRAMVNSIHLFIGIQRSLSVASLLSLLTQRATQR